MMGDRRLFQLRDTGRKEIANLLPPFASSHMPPREIMMRPDLRMAPIDIGVKRRRRSRHVTTVDIVVIDILDQVTSKIF